ncbi:diguanylate cyclase domain-containing protein [Lacimonas salitolerans]|uniref:diguanylate cyclase n=1 Tax=Lacimonas salitolerans TaxID=1323750 RepID=A0ABW4EC73_9RHOB
MPARILVVDPLPINRIVMRARLASAFYDTVLAGTGAEALAQLADGGAALAVIAPELRDMSGLALCGSIRARHTAGELPIVMITPAHATTLRIDALQAGADAVLERPVNDSLLLARIRCLLRASEGLEELRLREGSTRALGLAEPAQMFQYAARIAVMGADGAAAAGLRASLNARMGHSVAVLDGPHLMRALPDGGAPDLGLVLLTGRPDDPALHLISGLRAQPETRAMAIMALVPDRDDPLMADALERGAHDVAIAALPATELDLRLNRLIAAKHRADRLRDTVHDGLRAAVTDPLTGLYNRRYALPQLARMAQEARARRQGLAVMIADLDHFKVVNDSHGHAVGDAVLQQVAARLRVALRPGDLLARIGGEEFLIAAPRGTCTQAKAAASALCRAVGDAPIMVPGCPTPLRQTISVGLAMDRVRDATRAPEALLAQADRALYSAKTGGRNTVTLARQTAA